MLPSDKILLFRRPRRDTLRIVGVLALVASSALAIAGVSSDASAATGGKLTICHRTHSVTNPYRRITVSVSAANGSSANDHTHHNDLPFNLATRYPANAKNWGDVIPDNAGGGTGSGLNWVGSALGQAIYLGTTYLTDNYAGTCGAMTAQQFYDTELAAGVPIAQILADLDDQKAVEDAALLAVIGSFSSPTATSASFSTTTTSTAVPTTAAPTTAAPTTAAPTTAAPTTAAPTTAAPTTAAPTTAAPTTAAPTTAAPTTAAPTTAAPTTASPTTAAPTTATPTTEAPTTAAPTTASPTTDGSTSTTAAAVTSTTSAVTSTTAVTTTTTVTPNPAGARIVGIAWFDRNRDGVRQDDEPPLPGVSVQLQSGASPIPSPESARRSAVVLAAPAIVTGVDGRYSFRGLAAGAYRVTLHTDAAGVSRFWDTDGVADWSVDVVVPAEGVGIADVAAVGTAHVTGTVVWAPTSAPVDGALVECHWMGVDGIADSADDVTFTTHATATGEFELQDVPSGAYRCAASDAISGQLAWFALAVTGVDVDAGTIRLGVASDSTTTGATLPRTGGSGAPLALVALLLLGVGSLLASVDAPFVRSRRRID